MAAGRGTLRTGLGRAAIGALLLGSSACHETSPSPDFGAAGPADGSSSARAPTLTPSVLGEALRALEAYVPSGESVLEVRATADRVLLQVRKGQTDTVAEYSYDGRVIGPVPTHLAGNGELEANLFDLRAVDWKALGRLFPRARDAVDPEDGRVTELVVRRHLPFRRDVLARLYVASPRMHGHLDADARGRIASPRSSEQGRDP